ncbi:MAG TPA: glycosyltransferase family 1 protein [Candidatus Lokiarchaeia archaeon]
MKIGFYINEFDPKNPGGPTTYQINIIKELKKNKDFDIYLIANKKIDHQIFKENKAIILPKLPLFNLLKIKKYDLDVIHFNYVPYLPTEVFICLFMKKIKKVATLHGDGLYVVPELFDYLNPFLKNYCRFIQPRLINKFDALLPVSLTLGERLLKYFKTPKDKYHTIYNGLNYELFKHVENAKTIMKEKYGLEKDFILHVSNYSIQKNPKVLLKTFEKLVDEEGLDLDLVIAGELWKEKINIFLTEISPNVKQRIKIIGSVPQNNLPVFYSAAKLLFSPSYHETFCFPNIEAMACGTPVVTSNVYSLPEITGGAALLRDPNDLSGFVTAIKSILINDDLRRDIIRKGLNNAKRFSWEKSGEEIAKIFNQLK